MQCIGTKNAPSHVEMLYEFLYIEIAPSYARNIVLIFTEKKDKK
jgi:hypothetical protein